MLPGTLEERRALALEVMDYINFFPAAFEKNHPTVLGLVIHTLTDLRIQEPTGLKRRSKVISAIKKNKKLWTKIKVYFKANPVNAWYELCTCTHRGIHHTTVRDPLTGISQKRERCKLEGCDCKKFTEAPL